MASLRIIFLDQLTKDIASLRGCNKGDVILLCENFDDFTHVKHHKKKIVFLLSAMRHFVEEVSSEGLNVKHIKLEDNDPKTSYFDIVSSILAKEKFEKIIITKPTDHRLRLLVRKMQTDLKTDIELLEDDRFFCTKQEFKQWAEGRKSLRMENFYQMMRQKHNILMDGDQPVGGQWNYDKDNRHFPKEDLNPPKTYHQKPDKITNEVIKLVQKHFSDHCGEIEPFHFAVNQQQAREALALFIKERLENFGTYQDAMIEKEPWMYHSHLSFYLNCGLLTAAECIEAAEKAYKQKKIAINNVEGFIRQILGWREYIRGIYLLKMPGYEKENFFQAKGKLPEFFWHGKTKMNCLKQSIQATMKYSYAHHIQRLMVIGNFCLLSGIDPKYVQEWFLIVYADAFEWVELPNVSGMSLFADGGVLASKPYASSGSYINKMSNYCDNCQYSIKEKTGENACPFNYLYWHFVANNYDVLSKNHRMSMICNSYTKMSDDKQKQITKDSQSFLKELYSQ